MKFLVDANVLSEATRSRPEPGVIDWLRQHEQDLAVDPVILGEIRFGILLLDAGRRRRRLEKWFEQAVARIHCLPSEAAQGVRWAELLADLRQRGKTMPVKDSLIAATALTHDLTLATRNVEDFAHSGVRLENPFGQSR